MAVSYTHLDVYKRQDENGAWHYLGSDGKAVNTGEKAGWQQPEKDWYYLKEDGTIDTSKAGWVQIENVRCV